MNSNAFLELCEARKQEIKDSYENPVSLEEAGRLAEKFLHAGIEACDVLRIADLDARMRKAGLKAVKAAVYLDTATKGEKKPSDTFIEAVVNRDKLVIDEQQAFDEAEVYREALQNYKEIFKEAHIYYRGMSRGRFE